MAVAEAVRTSSYSVLDVPVSVTSDAPEALDRVDETYAAYRTERHGSASGCVAFELRRVDDGSFEVSGPAGERRVWPGEHPALLDLQGRRSPATGWHAGGGACTPRSCRTARCATSCSTWWARSARRDSTRSR